MTSLHLDDEDQESTIAVRSEGRDSRAHSGRTEIPILQSDGTIADLSFICFIVILSVVVFACFL